MTVLIDTRITSAHQISDLCRPLGYDVTSTQLDVGQLNGYFRVVLCGKQLFLLLSADKPVVIYGSRLAEYSSFGMFLSDFKVAHHTHAHGHKAVANWSSSFSPLHDETFLQLAPNVPMLVTYVAHSDLKNSALNWHEHDALHKITNKQFAVFQPEAYERIVRAAMYRLLYPSPDVGDHLADQFTLQMYDLFNQLSTDQELVQSFKRVDLIKDFFKYAIDNCCTPVKIKDVADTLYTSNTTLIKGCYDIFGVKPMDVLKNIRLEQTHRALTQKNVQCELGLYQVADIARHYGFESRPHFAKNYSEMYGMTPVKALQFAG